MKNAVGKHIAVYHSNEKVTKQRLWQLFAGNYIHINFI